MHVREYPLVQILISLNNKNLESDIGVHTGKREEEQSAPSSNLYKMLKLNGVSSIYKSQD